MRRSRAFIGLALSWLALSSLLACAKPPEDSAQRVHVSAIGYRVVVPADWALADRSFLAGLHGPNAAEGTDRIDPAMIESVRSLVESGEMEFFFLPTGTKTFRDNVNVLRTPGTIPATKEVVPAACAATARQISDAMGTPVAFRRCERIRIGGRPAFLIDSSNSAQRTRTVQYAFVLTPSTILVASGAFSEETAEINAERFRTFVESMEIETEADE